MAKSGVNGHSVCAGAKAWLAVAVLAAAVIPAAHATPRIYYVDAAYTGIQDGSSNRPYTSIAGALAQTADGAGDSVLVRQGVYAGGFTVWPGVNLLSEDGAAYTHIEGSGMNAIDLVRLDDGAVLRGFTISGAGGAAVRVLLNAQAEIMNCVLDGNATGLLLDTGASAAAVNNTIAGNGAGITLEKNAMVDPFRNSILAENTYGLGISTGAIVASDYNAYHRNGTLAVGSFTPGDYDSPVNPQFVDASALNYHLRAGSLLRDAGDPALGFNDRDDSRNDLGADGGPFGVLDDLGPQALVTAELTPPSGLPPAAVYFDAGASYDAWGINAWEWDFDARDGFGPDAYGSANGKLFTVPGGYLVTLRVRDNAGHESTSVLPIRIGGAPEITACSASPAIGPAPLRVQLDATAAQASVTFAWDLNNDGTPDLRGTDLSYTFPQGVNPGLYAIVLTANDAQDVFAQQRLLISISTAVPAASTALLLGHAADLSVENAASGLNGLKVHFPANAHSEAMTVGVAPVDASRLPALPGGALIQAFELAPAGVWLSAYAAVRVPVSEASENAQVWFYDAMKGAWSGAAARHVRGVDGSVTFDTGRLGLYALTRPEESKTGALLCCAPAAGAPGQNRNGDAALFGAGLFGLLFSRRCRKQVQGMRTEAK